MQQNRKYQKRLWITIIISVMVVFFAWKGAFEKTWSLYRQIKRLENSIHSSALIASKKQEIQSETEQLNLILGIHDHYLPAEQIFEELVSICDSTGNLRIVNFPDIHTIIVNSYKITTMFAGVEGNYSNLLKMVYKLERNKKTGRLASVYFRKKKDYRKNKEFLSATIFLQNYELTKNQ